MIFRVLKTVSWVVFVWAFFVLVRPVSASAWDWQALEQHPFRVYHKSSQVLRARQVLNSLLVTAPPLLDYFNGTVSEPDVFGVEPDLSGRPWLNVVVDDAGLVANGWVNGSNGKILFLQALPDTRQFLQLGSYWEHLAVHEITHYAQLRMKRPAKDLFSWILSPIVYPNRALPLFLKEGTAVWEESRNGQYGRLHDGYTASVVHAQVQADNAMSLAELRYPYYRFPYGNAPYLYGGAFTQFLVRSSSDIALRDLYVRHAENAAGAVAGYVLPSLGIDAAAMKTYGKDIPTLFSEWKAGESAIISPRTWEQKTDSEGYKRFLSVHRGVVYYVKTTYRHPRIFETMRPRYDVVRWSETEGEVLIYRSQRPIVGLQLSVSDMVLLVEDIAPGFENHTWLGYGISRILQKISLTHLSVTTLASGPIVGFTVKENQVFYTTPHPNGVGSVLWGVFNGQTECLGDLPVYVAEMVPFQRELAIIAKTESGPWQLFSLDPMGLNVSPLLRTRQAVARLWGDDSDLYMSINDPSGYQMHRLRGQSGALEQLTTSNHAAYGAPLGDTLFVIGVTDKGDELFSLPLQPQAAPSLSSGHGVGAVSQGQPLSNFEALGTNIDSLLPHRVSFGDNGLGVFGEDTLALMSYHLGYSDGFDVAVHSRVLSPLEFRAAFSSVENDFQVAWPFFRGLAPGLQAASLQMTYHWESWVPALKSEWVWWDTRVSQMVGVGLDRGYTLRGEVSQIIGDGTVGLLFERDADMDRADKRRGYAKIHLEKITGDRIEASLTHRLMPIRLGLWSPDVFFGDVFAELYVGTQSFEDSGAYYGGELQLEGYFAGGARILPYIGLAHYPLEDMFYGGVRIQIGE